MANISFVGLGIMGKPRAEHLIKGGHSLFLYSRSRGVCGFGYYVEEGGFFTEGCSAYAYIGGMLNCKIQYLTKGMTKMMTEIIGSNNDVLVRI